MSGNQLSDSLTILGVCNEIVGDTETAYYCYGTALKYKYGICPTAANRKVNLNMTWTLITSAICIFHSAPTKCIVSY